MNSYWLKLNGDIIVDAIEYEFDGYIHVQLSDQQFPAGIGGGWYRWDGTQYIFDQDLYNQVHAGE